MFPEDFFGSPNQYKTIQTPVNKNKEHPKIINPTLLKTITNQPYIIEIKEEICEESLEIPQNINSLKIIIPNNISNEEISTSGGSYNSPNPPNNPVRSVIHTEPNKNRKKGSNLKDKLISNNSLNNQLQNINDNNNIRDENIDLYYPMAFTFNRKEKKSRTLNNNKRKFYKYNNSFDKNNKNKINKVNKNKINKDIKKKEKSYQKNNENKIIKENKHQRNNSLKNNNNKDKNITNKYSNLGYKKSYSCEQSNCKYQNEKNMKNNKKNEIKKNSRNNPGSLYDRKAKSAKKSKETINILTIKNNKNFFKRNNKDDKKGLFNKNNLKNFKSEYNNKKKEIVHSKVKNEINQILQNLPDNYEKFPEINNKFELLMKNINDFKYVLDKKNSKNIYKQ